MRSIENHSKITVNDVSTWYGSNAVLKEINMIIREQTITGLIGPSGCGKSTFLRCLNRLNDLVMHFRIKGEISLDGENIYAPHTNVVLMRRRIGMVFQQPNPFPASIFDNVAFGAREHNRQIKRAELTDIVEESLKKANLWKEVSLKLNCSALNLSGGQQQRLCIARVLAVKPEIILFDEPCSSLDPASTAKIEELMVGLKDSYSVVVVTHNLGQAKRISDYVGFFLDGRLVEYGLTPEIFNNPQNKFTADYLEGNFG